MKPRYGIVFLLPLALLLASCPVPTGLQVADEGAASPLSAASFSVETDAARGLAVFLDGQGARVDVEAVEEDGASVACVEALGVIALDDETAAKGFARRPALVLGRRSDGKPGAWVVLPDNTVQPVLDADSGKLTSCLPESDEKEGTFRGRFGWVYHVMGISEDGRLIAGHAVHERGFSFGRWKIPAGTSIGVYWRIWKHASRPYWVVSRARIIGTYVAARLPVPGMRNHLLNHPRRHTLDQLKWFLLDYLTAYLVTVDKGGVHKDPASENYLVSGIDQDGDAALARIEGTGRIGIEKAAPPSTDVDLLPGAMVSPEKSVADGGRLAVSLPVQNLESGTLGAEFRIDFYLATTGSFDPSTDLAVGSSTVSSGIGANATVTLNATLSIPELDITRNVYIYAVVDAGDAVVESDETNNRSSVANALVALVFNDEDAARSYPVRIETYAPAGSMITDTVMALYRDNGVHTAVSYVASDMSGGSDFSMLDYTAAGLEPGTYYVMVASWSGRNGPYAFTTRTLNITRPGFASSLASNAVDQGEPDDTPPVTDVTTNTVVPEAPVLVGVGAAMNRYSAAGDWDWFTFVLP